MRTVQKQSDGWVRPAGCSWPSSTLVTQVSGGHQTQHFRVFLPSLYLERSSLSAWHLSEAHIDVAATFSSSFFFLAFLSASSQTNCSFISNPRTLSWASIIALIWLHTTYRFTPIPLFNLFSLTAETGLAACPFLCCHMAVSHQNA